MAICREIHFKQQQTPVYSQLDMYLPARRDVTAQIMKFSIKDMRMYIYIHALK